MDSVCEVGPCVRERVRTNVHVTSSPLHACCNVALTGVRKGLSRAHQSLIEREGSSKTHPPHYQLRHRKSLPHLDSTQKHFTFYSPSFRPFTQPFIFTGQKSQQGSSFQALLRDSESSLMPEPRSLPQTWLDSTGSQDHSHCL